MSDALRPGRREFLKAAGIFVAAAACAPTRDDSAKRAETEEPVDHHPRATGFDAPLLESLGATVLPASLGIAGRSAAAAAFVSWCEGYEPVAEEMHGYGYADIRYLPADPVPAWRAQLLAMGVTVSPLTCRPLGAALEKPVALSVAKS
jgi:hypothetical protein